MRVLVTGGVGFIGTNLIKKLLENGHDVISVDNYSTGFECNHQDGCQYITVDVSYQNMSFDFSDVDVIFHMAALARIQPSIKNPIKCLQNNSYIL